MSKIYVIGNVKFNHKDDNRPFASVEEMNKTIIDNWNKIVGDKDYVFVLGDFCEGSLDEAKEKASLLKGIKILIRENSEGVDKEFCDKTGFKSVWEDEANIRFGTFDRTVCFSHYEIEGSPYINLFGCAREDIEEDRTHKCVNLELWDYSPVLLDDLLKKDTKK